MANSLEDLETGAREAHVGTRVIYPDERMKQAQSETSQYRPADQSWSRGLVMSSRRRRTDEPLKRTLQIIERPSSRLWGELLITSIAALWFVISLPFRLIFWMIAWLGRLTVVVLGFTLMVVGIALWAGPLSLVGIPLFLVGLVLTLRCLD